MFSSHIAGMVKNQRLPANILTPTTKAVDHDVPVSPDEVCPNWLFLIDSTVLNLSVVLSQVNCILYHCFTETPTNFVFKICPRCPLLGYSSHAKLLQKLLIDTHVICELFCFPACWDTLNYRICEVYWNCC